MAVSDVVGLAVIVAVVAAIFLARKRSQRAQAQAISAVRLEGFEAGKAAVLASIGSTVVVNTQVGTGNHATDDGRNNDDHRAGAIDHRAPAGELAGYDTRNDLGLPVGLHPGVLDRDIRADRTEAILRDELGYLRITANGNSTPYRDRSDVSGRGPGS